MAAFTQGAPVGGMRREIRFLGIPVPRPEREAGGGREPRRRAGGLARRRGRREQPSLLRRELAGGQMGELQQTLGS